MRIKFNLTIVLSLIFVIFFGCSNTTPVNSVIPEIKKAVPLKIMTTNYLLYDMVKSVVKDINDVSFMFKNEDDQWNFTFTDDSVTNVNKQDIFFYTGGDFEPWIADFVDSLNKNKVVILNLSRGAKLLSRETPKKYISATSPKIIEVTNNPYYWLDIDKYRTAFFNITKNIEDKDSINKQYYEANYHNMLTTLTSYEKRFKDIKTGLKDYAFVVADDKLDYLTDYLDFNIIKLPANFNSEDSLDATKKLTDKLAKTDKLIFLNTDSTNIQPNIKKVINAYNMKVSDILVYQYKKSYTDILENNCESLEKWVSITSNG